MRSSIPTARAWTRAHSFIPALVAAAVVVTAACSDSTPTAPTASVAVPDAPAATIIPSCMPGCARIIYEHRSSSTAKTELWVMGPDGSGKMKLADGARPAWSADQLKVAYVMLQANYDIFSMNRDGTGVTRLTSSPAQDLDPSWAPDRKHIVFSSNRAGSYDLWIMEANGANPVRLTLSDRDNETYPAWSPDGTKIAFMTRSASGGATRIQIIDLTTKAVTTPITNSLSSMLPAWSPDGKRLAFAGDHTATSCGIWILNVGGFTSVTPFKGTPFGTCSQPSFSPDGKKLAYTSFYNGGATIHSANIDGTNGYKVLTYGLPFLETSPVWTFR